MKPGNQKVLFQKGCATIVTICKVESAPPPPPPTNALSFNFSVRSYAFCPSLIGRMSNKTPLQKRNLIRIELCVPNKYILIPGYII